MSACFQPQQSRMKITCRLFFCLWNNLHTTAFTICILLCSWHGICHDIWVDSIPLCQDFNTVDSLKKEEKKAKPRKTIDVYCDKNFKELKEGHFTFFYIYKFPCIYNVNVFHYVSCSNSSAVFVRTKYNTPLHLTAVFGSQLSYKTYKTVVALEHFFSFQFNSD